MSVLPPWILSPILCASQPIHASTSLLSFLAFGLPDRGSSLGTAKKPPNPLPIITLSLTLSLQCGLSWFSCYKLIGLVVVALPRRSANVGGLMRVRFHSNSVTAFVYRRRGREITVVTGRYSLLFPFAA